LAVAVALLLSGCMGGDRGASVVDPTTQDGGDGSLRADFAFSPTSARPNETVQFTDRSSGPVSDRAWDFGDGTSTTAPNPSHVYVAAGVYTVTLRVKDPQGNQALASALVPISATGQPPVPTDPNNPPPVLPPGFMTFRTPLTVQSSSGGEPSLAIDSKGNLYLMPIGRLWKSTDDGRTWSAITYPKTISGDSHVVVDPADRVYVADLQGFGLVVPILGPSNVWASTDGGATWGRGSFAASVLPFNDRQWLAAGKDDTAYLLYRFCTVPTPLGCFTIGSMMARTTDGGLTWTLASTRTFQWTSYPFIHADSNTLYVVQSTGTGIRVAVSTNGGSTWDERTVATRQTQTGNIFVSGATDDAGNAYITWSDTDRGQTDVWMAYSTNRGQAWRGPYLVSAAVGTHLFPWIDAGADGRVVVAWYGTTTVADPNTMPSGTPWHVYAAQSLNGHDDPPVFHVARVTPEPHHVGPVCTGGSGCGGNDRDLLDFFMVQVHPDGRAAIAYSHDGSTNNVRAMFAIQEDGARFR
jgi:PKD repeat protein